MFGAAAAPNIGSYHHKTFKSVQWIEENHSLDSRYKGFKFIIIQKQIIFLIIKITNKFILKELWVRPTLIFT